MSTTSHLRRLLVTLVLFMCIFTTSGEKVFAWKATEWTQLGNMALLNISQGFEYTTSIETTLLRHKEFVLDLVANLLIEEMLRMVADTLITWVNDGFSGNYPLLVSNPQEHLRNVGLDTARISLNNLGDGYFSDSIFNTIRETATWEYMPIQDKLEELTKSNTAELVQANSCGEDTISSMASEAGVDASELYTYLCEGDPSDPEVSARLEDFANENPEATGWDGWLSLTGGDNPYTRANTLARNEQVSEETGDIAREQLDLYEGQNPLSERECVDGGEDGEACEETELTTPSDTVSDTLSKSATAGLERLFNIQGDFTFSNLLQGFATQALLGGIRNGINGLTGRGQDGNSGRNLTPASAGTSPVDFTDRTTEGISRMVQNMNSIVASAKKIFTDYLGELTKYKTDLDKVSSCKEEVASRGLYWGRNQEYTNRYNYITTKIGSVTSEINTHITPIENAAKAIEIQIANSGQGSASGLISDFQLLVRDSWIFDEDAFVQKSYTISQERSEISDTLPADFLKSCTDLLQGATDTTAGGPNGT